MFDLTCLTMKDPPNNKTWNCKDIDNYRCGSLDQVFMVGTLTMGIQYLYYHHVFSVAMATVPTRPLSTTVGLTGSPQPTSLTTAIIERIVILAIMATIHIIAIIAITTVTAMMAIHALPIHPQFYLMCCGYNNMGSNSTPVPGRAKNPWVSH